MLVRGHELQRVEARTGRRTTFTFLELSLFTKGADGYMGESQRAQPPQE